MNLVIFCLLVGGWALFQASNAHPLRKAKTVAQITDGASWIVGGIVAIAIGFWRPWFTSTWWKAVLFSIILFWIMSVLAHTFLGALLSVDTKNRIRVISLLIVLSAIAAGIFFGLRAIG